MPDPAFPSLQRLRPLLPAIAARASAADEACQLPPEDLAALADAGLLTAPLPAAQGGEGIGTEPHGGAAIFEVLRLLGHANPSLGRVFEAHVNVLRLVAHHGSRAQMARVAADCGAGLLWGLWVTDAPGRPVHMQDDRLSGAKGPCSGAGLLRRALVTVQADGSTRMALIRLHGTEPVERLGDRLLGMRASANGTVGLDRMHLTADDLVGGPGAYLAEPDFSTGAWRGSAIAAGALEALVDTVRHQVRRRGQHGAPLQQARFGAMLIGLGTARLWARDAARVAEGAVGSPVEQVATVNLARIAAELACLEVMQHAQRALGLGALVRPNPAERLLRDLTTFLRQPAPDEVLTEAARHALERP